MSIKRKPTGFILLLIVPGVLLWVLMQASGPTGSGEAGVRKEAASSPGGVRLEDPPVRGEERRTTVASHVPAMVEGPATAATLVVQVTWQDGQPASECGVIVEAADSTPPLYGETDVNGIAVFEGLSAGQKAAMALLGGSASIWVGSGEYLVKLTIPEGTSVHVRVLDAIGGHVAGARIGLSSSQHSRDWWLLGLTDDQGWLTIPHVEPGRFLSVRARGFEPSPSVVIGEGVLDEQGRLEIRLRRGGSRLMGVVVDRETGLPVVGAHVQVSGGSREMPSRDGQARVHLHSYPAPAIATTDLEGYFSLGDLPSGALVTTVMHAGYLRWSEVSEFPNGGEGNTDVRLTRAEPLRGAVVDTKGVGIEGVMVSVGDPADGDYIYCLSGRRGRFELFGVPEGRSVVVAQGPGGLWKAVSIEMPSDGPPLLIEMEEPGSPTGIAVASGGEPLEGWYLTRMDQEPRPGLVPRSRPIARTDARGRFWLAPPTDRAGWLLFWAPVPAAPFPAGSTAFRPGRPVLFTSEGGVGGWASIRVRITSTGSKDWGSRPAVRLTQASTGFVVTRIVDGEGRASFPGLAEGEYRLGYLPEPTDVRDGGVVSVGKSEQCDLGTKSMDDLWRMRRTD